MNPTEIDGRIIALQQQRDEALNRLVILSGKLAVLEKELAELKTEHDAGHDDKGDQ